jgi:aspartyl-tRNA(Asn)/glutamyl-tRNA(Gln) amidotransferase subunit B
MEVEAATPNYTAFHTARPDQWIKGITGAADDNWEIIVGMEVHAQVSAKSKLFSGASASYGGDPNSHVAMVDARNASCYQ